MQAAQGDVAGCFARLDGCGAEPGLVQLCKRCLSPKPADRFADGSAVASAVARLRAEADERARRAELDRVREQGERAAAEARALERRRRRRVWFGAATTLALAVIGGLGAVLFVQREANARLAATNADLDDERARVQQRFELAQKAIEAFHTGVSGDALLKNEQLKELRDKLLRSAAGFYRELEGLLKERRDDESRQALGDAYFKLAYLTALIGDRTEALAVYQRSLGIRKKLAEANPAVTEYQIDLAGSYCNLGSLRRSGGDPQQSLPLFQQAIDCLQAVLKTQPRHPTARLFLRNSHYGRALAFERLKRHREAVGDWEQALALDSGSMKPFYQLRLALCQARCGDHARVVREAERLSGNSSASPTARYHAARLYALSAQAAAAEASRPLPERQKRAEGYARHAVELLRRAQLGGYFRKPQAVTDLEKDDDLASLRPREDFQALRKELQANAGGASGNPE